MIKESRIIEILVAHGLRTSDLTVHEWAELVGEKDPQSGCYPKADEESMVRLARIVATNKAMMQRQPHCYQPLAWSFAPPEAAPIAEAPPP